MSNLASPNESEPTMSLSGFAGLPYGFVTADQAPAKAKDTFTFPGQLGKFLGEQQRYRSQIILEGEKHSSKSELAKQMADAAIDMGLRVALVDWEQGGMLSKDTKNSIDRNLKPKNIPKLQVSADVPQTKEGLEQIARMFDMIIVDSGTKVKSMSNDWLEDLRVNHPQTIWVILMQRNSRGTTRGGTSAGYNAPVVIYTHRPEKTDFTKNYATLEKNRGNRLDLMYVISRKEVKQID